MIYVPRGWFRLINSGGSAHASGALGSVTIVMILNRQVGGVQSLEIRTLIVEFEHNGPRTPQAGWEVTDTAHTHAGTAQVTDPAGAQLVFRPDLATQRHQVQRRHGHSDSRQGPDPTTEDKPQDEGHNNRDPQTQEGALTTDMLIVGEFPVRLGIVVTTTPTTLSELHVRLGQFPGVLVRAIRSRTIRGDVILRSVTGCPCGTVVRDGPHAFLMVHEVDRCVVAVIQGVVVLGIPLRNDLNIRAVGSFFCSVRMSIHLDVPIVTCSIHRFDYISSHRGGGIGLSHHRAEGGGTGGGVLLIVTTPTVPTVLTLTVLADILSDILTAMAEDTGGILQLILLVLPLGGAVILLPGVPTEAWTAAHRNAAAALEDDTGVIESLTGLPDWLLAPKKQRCEHNKPHHHDQADQEEIGHLKHQTFRDGCTFKIIMTVTGVMVSTRPPRRFHSRKRPACLRRPTAVEGYSSANNATK